MALFRHDISDKTFSDIMSSHTHHKSIEKLIYCYPGNREYRVTKEAKDGAIGVPVYQTAVIPFVVGERFIKRHLEL